MFLKRNEIVLPHSSREVLIKPLFFSPFQSLCHSLYKLFTKQHRKSFLFTQFFKVDLQTLGIQMRVAQLMQICTHATHIKTDIWTHKITESFKYQHTWHTYKDIAAGQAGGGKGSPRVLIRCYQKLKDRTSNLICSLTVLMGFCNEPPFEQLWRRSMKLSRIQTPKRLKIIKKTFFPQDIQLDGNAHTHTLLSLV